MSQGRRPDFYGRISRNKLMRISKRISPQRILRKFASGLIPLPRHVLRPQPPTLPVQKPAAKALVRYCTSQAKTSAENGSFLCSNFRYPRLLSFLPTADQMIQITNSSDIHGIHTPPCKAGLAACTGREGSRERMNVNRTGLLVM